MNLIKKYDVDFIYIGHLERLYYDADGLNKFDSDNHDWAQLVYSNQEVKIYRTVRYEPQNNNSACSNLCLKEPYATIGTFIKLTVRL